MPKASRATTRGVTESQGQFFIESLAEHNPAYLNDSIVRVGEKRVMYPGDKVRVGKITLTFGLRQGVTQNMPNMQRTTVDPKTNA
jgi:hypothetical protein